MTAVFAHRGCTEGFVENTLEAFAEARRLGADGVELDVRLTADGALAVHHDAGIPGIGTIDQLAQSTANSAQTLTFSQTSSIGSCHHHHVASRRQAVAVQRKGLSQQALHLIALHRAANLARHRQAETGRGRVLAAREHIKNELTAAMRASVPKDTIEVGAARQPTPLRPGRVARPAAHQTVSRLRPFARRRLSTTRPARVCIRARNPCVRARLRFFGW